MQLLSKKAYFGLAATIAASVLGFLVGGLDLAAYAALSSILSCVVGALWIETHRLRRAQATRTNRIGERITRLEHQTSSVNELLLAQQEVLAKRLEGIEETQSVQAEALKASVHEVLAAFTADAALRGRELDDLRDATREAATSQADRIAGMVAESAQQSEGGLKRFGREENRTLYNKVEGLMALYRDIEPDRALPAMHGWAVTPDFARFLYREVIESERTRVFECGSGSTTVILAYALQSMGAGHVVALEHEAEFAAVTRRMLAERGLSEWAEVVHAPLVDVDLDGSTWRWYDPSVIPEGQIDMLLVDGPPGTTAPQARYPAMPMLADRLTPEAVILLDDADREEERAIKRRWMAEFDGYSAKFLKTDCGALVLRPASA